MKLYLIVGEVVALLGLCFAIDDEMRGTKLWPACAATAITVLVWPVPLFLVIRAFLRSLSRV